VAKEPAPDRSKWAFEAGAQVLTGVGAGASAVMLVGRGRVVAGERFAVRLTFSGLGSRPRIQAPEGSATMSQELGLLELLSEIAPRSRLRPYFSLGGGTYHISVEGSAVSPYQSFNGDRFTFAADAGIGVALTLTSSFAVALESHGTFVTPRPVLRFLEVEKSATNNVLLSGALTLVGRL
jgi:hypothetical protein